MINLEIHISNFGPIEHCSYDLSKSLIITYGQNNIGKSYAMQAVFLVLKNIIEMSEAMSYTFYNHEYADKDRLQGMVKIFAESGRSEKVITREINTELNRCLSEELMPGLRESLMNTFGHYERMLKEDSSVIIKTDDFGMMIDLAKDLISVNRKTGKPIILSKSSSGFHKSRDTKNGLYVYVYVDGGNKIKISDAIGVLDDAVKSMRNEIVETIIRFAGEAYYLPASRSGIMTGMNAMSQALALVARNRSRIHNKIEIPGISEPIYDFYLNMSSINRESFGRYYANSKIIEREVLDGDVTFDTEKMMIKYKQKGIDEEFEMADVSSMVAEISPITVFIKYVIGRKVNKKKAGKKDTHIVLFIEEPEAHLHPVTQIKLLQALCSMLDGGITILMASHSNYIMNKMNNMVLKKEISVSEYDAVFMEKGNEGRSTTRVMPSDELGVDDINFMDVANMLYEEREEAIAAMFEGQDE